MKKFLLFLIFFSSLTFSERISEIQGESLKSPYINKKVKDVQGIVTYILKDKYNTGVFIQSNEFDNNPNTSEGIYVEYPNVDQLRFGDLVSVDGVVFEKQFAKFDASRLTNTAILADKLNILAINLKPKVIEIDGAKLPNNIADDNMYRINKDESMIDYFASLESMLVKVKDPYITALKEEYGDIFVIPKLARDTKDLSENGGIIYHDYGFERKHIFSVTSKDSKFWNEKHFSNDFTPNPGDRFEEDIEGVLNFDNYNSIKIYPTKELSNIVDSGAIKDSPKYSFNEEMLNVVTYNVENYSHFSDPQRTYEFAIQVKDVLNTPDIINMVEFGDDDGDVESSVVSGEKNGQALIDAIKKITNIEYGYLEIAPEYGKDGGKPSLNIRTSVLYRLDRLKVKDMNKGYSYKDTYFENGKLAFNPGRIGTKSQEFDYTRKPLIINFDFNGKSIYTISLHLSSKRGDDATFGFNQPPIRKSEEHRHDQARYVNNFVKEILANDSEATVLVMGDINDFNFSKTTDLINGNELYDVMQELDKSQRYTYVYDGMSQVLDNVMLNKEYKGKVNVDVIRINSEFTKSQGSFSDHDPVFIQFQVK